MNQGVTLVRVESTRGVVLYNPMSLIGIKLDGEYAGKGRWLVVCMGDFNFWISALDERELFSKLGLSTLTNLNLKS